MAAFPEATRWGVAAFPEEKPCEETFPEAVRPLLPPCRFKVERRPEATFPDEARRCTLECRPNEERRVEGTFPDEAGCLETIFLELPRRLNLMIF